MYEYSVPETLPIGFEIEGKRYKEFTIYPAGLHEVMQ